MLVERKEYLERLLRWKDEQIIKVITGIRRCGKSTLLKMLRDRLLSEKIPPDRIIYINFEDIEFEELCNYKTLYNFICEKLSDEEKTYILLDEIQTVKDFQKAIDSLYIKDSVDIYITGSNAYLLSGELATLLSGRYVEINLLPLSFGEFVRLNPNNNTEVLFADYMRFGAMPYVAGLDPKDEEKIDSYLEGIYNTIIVKDIELRQQNEEAATNKRKINDITLLKTIAEFLADSIGNPISVKSITNYIVSSGRKISPNTVNDYIDGLTSPYIFYPVNRFDVFGKQLLSQNKKLYIADTGLRRHIVPKRNYDLGFTLENIVFLELIRRGYSVNIGKCGSREIDFAARKSDELMYYQVSASLTDENTFNREILPLRAINDNYSKTILTLDNYTEGNYDGIRVINAIAWLLGEKE